MRTRGRITDGELDGLLDELAKEQSNVEERLKAFHPEPEKKRPEPLDEDMVDELRKRLDTGLTLSNDRK